MTVLFICLNIAKQIHTLRHCTVHRSVQNKDQASLARSINCNPYYLASKDVSYHTLKYSRCSQDSLNKFFRDNINFNLGTNVGAHFMLSSLELTILIILIGQFSNENQLARKGRLATLKKEYILTKNKLERICKRRRLMFVVGQRWRAD